MGLLRRVLGWLIRVPVWIWLILTLTEIGNIVASASRLSQAQESDLLVGIKGQTPQDQAQLEQARKRDREFLERYRQHQWTQLIGGLVLGPIFLGMGCWCWCSAKPKEDSTCLAHSEKLDQSGIAP